jgi:hypothetical protein
MQHECSMSTSGMPFHLVIRRQSYNNEILNRLSHQGYKYNLIFRVVTERAFWCSYDIFEWLVFSSGKSFTCSHLYLSQNSQNNKSNNKCSNNTDILLNLCEFQNLMHKIWDTYGVELELIWHRRNSPRCPVWGRHEREAMDRGLPMRHTSVIKN